MKWGGVGVGVWGWRGRGSGLVISSWDPLFSASSYSWYYHVAFAARAGRLSPLWDDFILCLINLRDIVLYSSSSSCVVRREGGMVGGCVGVAVVYKHEGKGEKVKKKESFPSRHLRAWVMCRREEWRGGGVGGWEREKGPGWLTAPHPPSCVLHCAWWAVVVK